MYLWSLLTSMQSAEYTAGDGWVKADAPEVGAMGDDGTVLVTWVGAICRLSAHMLPWTLRDE